MTSRRVSVWILCLTFTASLPACRDGSPTTAPPAKLAILAETTDMPAESAVPTPDSLRWQARPVILTADRLEEPRLLEQLAELQKHRDALEERDVRVLIVAGDSVQADALRERSPIQAASAAQAWRERVGVSRDDAFHASLIGLDGGVKRRSETPMSVESLSALIDTMPMRRTELHQQAGDGQAD